MDVYNVLHTYTLVSDMRLFEVNLYDDDDNDVYKFKEERQRQAQSKEEDKKAEKNKFDIYDVIYYIPKCLALLFMPFFVCFYMYEEYLWYDGSLIKDVLRYVINIS